MNRWGNSIGAMVAVDRRRELTKVERWIGVLNRVSVTDLVGGEDSAISIMESFSLFFKRTIRKNARVS